MARHDELCYFSFCLRFSSSYIMCSKDKEHQPQRDGMGREVGGGFRMGTRVNPWQIHVDVWQNKYNIVK